MFISPKTRFILLEYWAWPWYKSQCVKTWKSIKHKRTDNNGYCHSKLFVMIKKITAEDIDFFFTKISKSDFSAMYHNTNKLRHVLQIISGQPWSYGSWIYNYQCNQCLSPLTLWVGIPFRQDVIDTTICDKVCQWLVAGQWFSPGTPVLSTNKTDHHDITEILL